MTGLKLSRFGLVPSITALLVWAACLVSPHAAVAAIPDPPETITEDDIIAGTMDIDFGTRTNLDTTGDLKKGSAALGAKDKYKLNFKVARTTQFTGDITRQPNLYTSTLARKKQDALLGFNIDLIVINPKDPKQSKAVGKWVGTVPIDTTSGAYDLAGGKAKESPLRIDVSAVGKAEAFRENFDGRLVGKAEKKDSLAQYTYKRVIGDKTVQVVVKKSDPMRFGGDLPAHGGQRTA
jgi:hypothetical protein